MSTSKRLHAGVKVETARHGPGVVMQIEWEQRLDPHGRPRNDAFVWVKFPDGHLNLLPIADVHPAFVCDIDESGGLAEDG